MGKTPRTTAVVKVGKRRLELSNLKKELFPDDHIIKAELVEYYLKAAPTLLRHIKGRPLSFVRYPEGIAGHAFFQKNRPEWAPDWIEHVTLGDEDKVDYILATEEASLVWLANLACIELHQMHGRSPRYDRPDYIVFDLDPPDKYPFPRVVEMALQLKEHIESFGYHTFVKTTGGKGVHVLAPIEPKWPFDEVFEAGLAMAKAFVKAHEQSATLQLKKAARKGRVLVDVYRNRPSQTIVSPYSIRGRPRAPVSMPLEWERLRAVSDPTIFNIRSVMDQLVREGDAWETMGHYATQLHTHRTSARKRTKSARPNPSTSGVSDALKTYAEKRSFQKTPEPPPELATGKGNAFVIHRHHASRLHYDLRLERGGTLKSWAVPKGLPPRPGIKRLAVATEDHPLSYTAFEGTIPKGEYGGGQMWIFARGKYELTKEKKESFYFRLRSRELNAEYRLINTKEKDWILERVDPIQVDWLHDPVEPMLAENRDTPPNSPDYLYEVKWDGIRAMISLDEKQLTIRSRSQRDITRFFPELLAGDGAFRATGGLFDAEVVCLDKEGKPIFEHVIHRLHAIGQTGIAHASAKYPAVCYVFDCLYLDGRPILNEPLVRRREWLKDAIRENPTYRVSEAVTEGLALYDAAAKMGLEGIMAKERNSPYLPGKRSASWLKIKAHQTTECVIIGFTEGKGDRETTFGAFHLATYQGDQLVYRGKVGSGFDERTRKSILAELQKVHRRKQPINGQPTKDAHTVWIEPKLVCQVRYASLTPGGALRAPVFMRLRPDLTLDDLKANT